MDRRRVEFEAEGEEVGEAVDDGSNYTSEIKAEEVGGEEVRQS